MIDRKLAPNFVWLFATATLLAAIVVTKLTPTALSPKAWGAIYFALYAIGSASAVYLTRSGAFRSILAFALAGAGLGVFYFLTIRSHMASAGALGTGTAMVFMIVFTVDALAAGIAGSLFALKFRKGLARMAA